jgi:hypothetical protein
MLLAAGNTNSFNQLRLGRAVVAKENRVPFRARFFVVWRISVIFCRAHFAYMKHECFSFR